MPIMNNRTATLSVVRVHYSDEDEAFIATSPEWPGIATDGETEIEAVKEFFVAVSAAKEVAERYGDPVPDADPILGRLYQMKDILNTAQIAQRSGINVNTFRAKLRRSSGFNPDEASRIRSVFDEIGIPL